MNKGNTPIFIALAVLLLASACLFGAEPATATLPSLSSINMTATRLSQFLTQAPRVTATLTNVPAPTSAGLSLDTATPFPSITPLPTATATFTNTPFGFVASNTPLPPTLTGIPTVSTPDKADGATDDWGSDYRCTLTAKSPPDWTVVPPDGKYKVSWTLLNSGRKRWQTTAMTLMYLSDTNLSAGEKTATLVRDVKVNESITPVINIYPPSKPGNYRSVWGLKLNKDGHIFCTFTIKITVK